MFKSNMREKIIKISADLFLKQGYHKSSMSGIANACGIQKGSIYHHFNGKEDLLEAVIHNIQESFRKNVFIIAYQEDIDPQERLTIILDYIEDYIKEDQGFLMTVIAPEIARPLPHLYQQIVAFYQELIISLRHIYLYYYDDKIADNLAEELVVKIEGAIMWIGINGNSTALHRICSQAKFELTQPKARQASII